MTAMEAFEKWADRNGWHAWRGVSGLVYVRRPRSSPPILFKGRHVAPVRRQAEVRQAALEARRKEMFGDDY